MAEKVTVQIVDDLDGSEAAETIVFGWDGRQLVIDLNTKNADKFRKAVEPYVKASRPNQAPQAAAKAAGRSRSARKAAGRADTSDIRAWARENGISVPDRGRLRPDVVASYDEAHA